MNSTTINPLIPNSNFEPEKRYEITHTNEDLFTERDYKLILRNVLSVITNTNEDSEKAFTAAILKATINIKAGEFDTYEDLFD
ncbi:hypothetical protein LEP1GSC195_0933 [Leptospira wolbachii serovar Codice str. CDC]|uniref:Uncharacterized protein n=1 Tax=Leptospira wolbachii serovar Codice str. CDC TaxID=1218599 RepID=R9A3K9_9LEPT|nr:hypothetical protein [Leptospira wolbachii]EOQ94815.1 hypothetical protein LEP1GSC195_0933 [Leptospira wolbachii serovar Codice str. CDC]